VRALLEECVQDRDAKDVFLAGATKRLLIGMVQSAEDLLNCEHLNERQAFAEVAHPATNTHLQFPAELTKLSVTPTKVRRRSPMLDEHRHEILVTQLGLSSDELARLDVAKVTGH
jgi:crotonobetainyl-CoA:carnitine CoA-transferase CaiB-like acyl-CoA transferase